MREGEIKEKGNERSQIGKPDIGGLNANIIVVNANNSVHCWNYSIAQGVYALGAIKFKDFFMAQIKKLKARFFGIKWLLKWILHKREY